MVGKNRDTFLFKKLSQRSSFKVFSFKNEQLYVIKKMNIEYSHLVLDMSLRLYCI